MVAAKHVANLPAGAVQGPPPRLPWRRSKGQHMARDDRERNAESQRIIRRVGTESEVSMARKVRNHMAGADADQQDWAELWGTRIGRILGALLLAYLLWWLIGFFAGGA